ncbi:MAG: alanine racemase [Planctomycetes bacterium]|nr:alanine racemase [Planctomycetota bacterium]
MLDIEIGHKKTLIRIGRKKSLKTQVVSGGTSSEKSAKKSFVKKDLCAYLYTDAISHNIQQLRKCCKDDVMFCAVVKANAYGHGILEVVDFLKDTDIDFFAVASTDEAFRIAKRIKRQQILILDPLYPSIPHKDIKQCASLGFNCTVSSIETAKYIDSILNNTSSTLKVHVNIDTGMGRCGIVAENAGELVEYIYNSSTMKLSGIYTHFANSDEQDLSFAEKQIASFKKLISQLDHCITDNVIIHVANSSATMRLPQSHFDMVRCGIAIYGYSTMKKPLPIDLKPALKLQAPIVHIITIEKGNSVNYGRKFIVDRKTKAAVLPVGYSGGFWRPFSSCSRVRINEHIVNVIGTITMNQMVIDVTDVPDVQLGQPVTIIDNRLDSPCSVYSLAALSKTICYEILTSIPTWANVIVSNNS